MNYTDMIKNVEERAREIIAQTNYKDWYYEYVKFEDNKFIICVGKSFYGEYDYEYIEVSPEDFEK